MSETNNIAIVQQLYHAFSKADIESVLALMSDEVDWLFYGPSVIPFAGHYHGPEQVEQFFRTALDTMDFIEFEPQEFVGASQSRVLVQGHEKGRAKTTNRGWEVEWAHVFTLAEGKIIKMREYYDTAALVAAFSSES